MIVCGMVGDARLTEASRARCRRFAIGIALSGGVFQHEWLIEEQVGALDGGPVRIVSNRQAPADDGAISLGQAVRASAGSRS